MTHVDPNDVSQIGFYTTHDTRPSSSRTSG